MFRLSIQTRQGISRLTLPLLFGLSCGLMALSQADRPLAAWLHGLVTDWLAPLYAQLDRPARGMRGLVTELGDLGHLARQNRRLRAENGELRGWYEVAVGLAAENKALKAKLYWLPDPAPSFMTARAVADAGGIYGRAVLLAAGSDQGLRKGEVAMDAGGLVGRVSEIGARSARVLLITDLSSRVPVTLDGSHASAIVVGSDAPTLRLMYYPNDIHPEEGERVLTSGEANAFPAGLPVGIVHYSAPGQPLVLPAARLDHVDLLRIFDYGLSAVTPPEAPGHVQAPGRLAPGRLAPGSRPVVGHG